MKPIPTETATDVGSVGKWLGAAAAGALLMYLLDPDRGPGRRSRALSALRDAGARTGATVDHALHSAGDRLAGLKDSAAGALSRGAGRLQAGAAPMLERARHGAQEATHRLEDRADRIRERARDAGYSYRHDSEEPVRRHAGAGEERGRSGGWLRGRAPVRGDDAAPHPALVGGGMLGLLSLMRRSPGGLLAGLAGLALLMYGTRDRTYRVSDNIGAAPLRVRHEAEHGQAPPAPAGEQAGSRYLH